MYLFIFGCAGSPCCIDFALIVMSRGCSLVAMHWLVIVMASLVAEHRPWSVGASVVAAPRV